METTKVDEDCSLDDDTNGSLVDDRAPDARPGPEGVELVTYNSGLQGHNDQTTQSSLLQDTASDPAPPADGPPPSGWARARPDGGYGWVVVGASLVAGTLLGIMGSGFALLYADIAAHHRAGMAHVGWIGSVFTAASTFPGTVLTYTAYMYHK